MDPELEASYETIVKNITSAKGQCILVLGPELSVNQQGVGYRKFFRECCERNAVGATYFDEENVFFFNGDRNKETIETAFNDFYANCGDQNLLELISRIEFPLIINACPDISLNDVYDEKGIEYRSGYFAENSIQEFRELPIPTKKLPVIYNILGRYDIDLSQILTHEKLFKTLENLLPKNTLPPNIEYYIKDIANSFIFLGFDFESWHYQLLCHRLGIEPKKKLCTPSPVTRVNQIMKQSFRMSFTPDNSYQCIRIIIDKMNQRGSFLRPAQVDSKYTIFISYAWNDVPDGAVESKPNLRREDIVKLAEQEINGVQKLYSILLDKKDLEYGESINSFMHTIGAGKTVLLVVSDKFLKSRYCMMEAYRAAKYADSDHRRFIVLMDDAREAINNDGYHSYKEYWLKKCQAYLNNAADIGKQEFNDSVEIYGFIEEFVAGLNDQKNLVLTYEDIGFENNKYAFIDPQKAAAFESFKDSIIKKMTSND